MKTSAPVSIDSREIKPQREAWVNVGGKKSATHKTRLRPELIIISKKSDMTYADILRKVKSGLELMDPGENVSRIKRSQKGDLMLELKKSLGKAVKNFLGKGVKSFGEETQVQARKQEIVIQCKEIDEITIKEDLVAP